MFLPDSGRLAQWVAACWCTNRALSCHNPNLVSLIHSLVSDTCLAPRGIGICFPTEGHEWRVLPPEISPIRNLGQIVGQQLTLSFCIYNVNEFDQIIYNCYLDPTLVCSIVSHWIWNNERGMQGLLGQSTNKNSKHYQFEIKSIFIFMFVLVGLKLWI